MFSCLMTFHDSIDFTIDLIIRRVESKNFKYSCTRQIEWPLENEVTFFVFTK